MITIVITSSATWDHSIIWKNLNFVGKLGKGKVLALDRINLELRIRQEWPAGENSNQRKRRIAYRHGVCTGTSTGTEYR